MRLSHIFIDRPILATVLSVFVTLIGLGALAILPVAQYPEIVPPTVQITTVYPGASADTVARTVATPLEQQINGVENMLYLSSQSTGDGKLTITVTFRIGTDLNVAQMLTQNRVQDTLPRLPEDVQRLGVQVRKATPNILLAVHLMSPDSSRDDLYMSNYATLHVKDALARLPGVGDVQLFGARDYAMRIWLDPDKVAANNLSAAEVLAALRAQNIQVSAGILNQPPVPSREAYQINVQTLGRLSTPQQFADIVLKSDAQGRVTRLRDVGASRSAPRITDRPLSRIAVRDCRCSSSRSRERTRWRWSTRSCRRCRPWRRISRPALLTRSSTIRRFSSVSRSRRSLAPYSSLSCWWSGSCSFSCNGGARRSSRSLRFRSR
jgi:Cation/multidrug efflux pump